MSDHTHHLNQFDDSIHAYPHKYQPHNYNHSWDIPDLLFLNYFGHTQPCQTIPTRHLWINTVLLSMCKKSTSYIKSILRYWTFKNLATWLVETIWGFNTKTRILPDVGFAMGGQELQQFSFPTISRKIKWQNFGALSAQTWAKIISLPVSF